MSTPFMRGHWDRTFARQIRRSYLDITTKRARPGTGSSWAFLQMREWSDLNVNLSNIRTPFVIMGAVATRLYMPERLTRDLDILVHSSRESEIEQELSHLGCSLQFRRSAGGTSWIAENGEQLNVLALDAPWVQPALDTPERAPDGLPVIALPYLVLLKLNASRGLDIGDLTRMLGLADEPARSRVRHVVKTYQPEDSEDLESLIALGDLEFGAERAAHE